MMNRMKSFDGKEFFRDRSIFVLGRPILNAK